MLFLQTQDDSRRIFRAEAYLDLRPANLIEQFAQAGIAGDIDLKTAQGFGDGILAGVADRGDFATVQILQHEGFEDVVDLLGFEAQFRTARPFDQAIVFEISDTAAIQHDGFHRDRCGLIHGRLLFFRDDLRDGVATVIPRRRHCRTEYRRRQ